MYFDGSLKLGGGGADVLFISPKGEQLKFIFQIKAYLTTKQNTKPSYTASDWPSHLASSGYSSTETPSLWSSK